MNTKEITRINNRVDDNMISLFDEQFSIEGFETAIEKSETESNKIIASAKDTIKNALRKRDAESNYVVDMSDELKASIDKGEVELVAGKGGELYAVLRGEKGQFSKPLPIKKELEEKGITTDQLQLALQMEAIKEQLKKIVEDLKNIEGLVGDVKKGQRNDRLGLFYSGLSLYVESKSIKDPTLRLQVVAQSLRSISDANAQIIQEARDSIEYLVTKKYNKVKNKTEKINEHIETIHQCYEVISKAAFVKAIIYQESGELGAMLSSLSEYGRFLEKMIVPHASQLSELDKDDRLIETGKWGTIAKSLEACNEMKERISAGNVLQLSEGGAINGVR